MIQIDPTQRVPLHIDADENVRVAGTRVTLNTLVASYRQGSTAEEIAFSFPGLPLADVHACIAYYLTHQAELDGYLAAQEKEAEVLREQIASTQAHRAAMQAFRDRVLLMGRRAS